MKYIVVERENVLEKATEVSMWVASYWKGKVISGSMNWDYSRQ